MKQSIKKIIAAVLIVPMLALGVSVSNPAVSSVGADSPCTGGAVNCLTTGSTTGTGATNNAKPLFGSDGIVTQVINWMLYIIGSLSVIMLIVGGIRYTMSAGNEKSVGAAKNTILYAIIGVVVAVLAYAIVNFVIGAFTATK
jgi:hypothetical protein